MVKRRAKKRKDEKPSGRRRESEHPTIGVLAGWQVYGGGLHGFLGPMFSGIRSAARDRGCNLLLACGVSYVPSTDAVPPICPAWPFPSSEADFVPVGPWNTDGLIVVTPLLSEARSHDVQQVIAAGHPLVFVGAGEGGPAIVPDNEGGIRQALAHLAEHGHRRIAFVAGYETGSSGDALCRDRAYRSAVQEYGLEADDALIVYGSHNRAGGHQAMQRLLGAGVPFTAVLASNDESASGAMEALREGGLRVPHDVAVVGFDDRFDAAVQVPPLTSIHYSPFEMGHQALELLLDYISGRKDGVEVVRVTTRLVIRQSCGCRPGVVAGAVPSSSGQQASPDKLASSDHGRKIESQLAHAMAEAVLGETRHLGLGEVHAMCRRLVETFASALEEGEVGDFYQALQEVLRQVEVAGDDPHIWQSAISVLEDGLPSLLKGQDQIAAHRQAMAVLSQARVSISESVQRQYRQRVVHDNSMVSRVGLLTANLLTATDEAQILEALAEHLPGMGIQRAYTAFFEAEDKDPVAWSVLHPVLGAADRFPSRQFPPESLRLGEERFTLALLPLVIAGEQAGFVAFETADLEPCAAVVRQLASAHERRRVEEELQQAHEELALHTSNLERWVTQLRTAATVARDATATLDVQQLLAETVSSISARFGLYHVGIFLVGEGGESVVLQAASSESGQRMLEDGYRLGIGEDGIIGSVVVAGEPRVALDVGEDNPHFPDTRSRLVLPLKVRGDVIGVLDIQSSEAVSFDEGDIAVLQTMADQLVIALENARLFEETQMRVQELSMLFEVSRSLAGAPLQPREICAAVARQFIEVLGIQECGIHLLADRQGDAMWILFEEGVFRWEGEGGAEVYSLSKYPATARVVETRLPLVVQASDPEPPAAERAYMEKYGLATLAIIPMSVKGQAIGTIELSTWGEERHYTPVELNLAITLANQAAAALENARLFRAVEEKQRYLRTVLDSVNHAMVVTDLEGRVHLANRAMEVLLGISEGEAIDQPLAEVGGEALSDVAERITVGEVAGPEALQMELSDGRALVAHLTPITDPQGEHVGYVVAMADVSALHRLNQLKSRVIRIASHDLRNPLHLAAGFFKILLDDLPLLTAQQSALAQRVLNHLDAMERLVDNLLELERVEVAGADQLERLDMGVVVQKVLRDQCLQVELKQHFLWSEIAEDLPMVRGERVMLAQAVSNLVDNAVKYTQEGGEISVRVWAEGDEVLVTVQDNGPGIPPEDQSRVFDQFYRGHQPGTEHVPGSGLGLSLVQAIAQQHRGRVWVESEGTPGSGSTFGIALPVD